MTTQLSLPCARPPLALVLASWWGGPWTPLHGPVAPQDAADMARRAEARHPERRRLRVAVVGVERGS